MSIYDIPGIVRESLPQAATPTNGHAGFRCTGIWLFNRGIFQYCDFAPSLVTDCLLPPSAVPPLRATSSNRATFRCASSNSTTSSDRATFLLCVSLKTINLWDGYRRLLTRSYLATSQSRSQKRMCKRQETTLHCHPYRNSCEGGIRDIKQ
ncbi:hypothetical protein N1851_013857 [Merluccius polli]|uniref:Uncharacterized protein n=1 Tax=Merluccius polli TaxID=89951 RepID=A0AA47P3Z8_MERPO|nr:hypothetical protein N1851_013857 [Merluccius polli]